MKNKYNYIEVIITSCGPQFYLGKSGDGREFFLGKREGPFGFSPDAEGVANFNGEELWRVRQVIKGSHLLVLPGDYDHIHGNHRAVYWGLLSDAKQAERNFIPPTIYVIMRRERTVKPGGKLGSWRSPKEVFRGTAVEMQMESGRDGYRRSESDQFAPIHTTPGFLSENICFRLEGENKIPCVDPRPLPRTGPLYRVTRVITGCMPRVLAQGTALEISFEWPRRRGGNDGLANTQDATILWEMMKGDQWTISELDPRHLEEGVTATPLDNGALVNMADAMVGGVINRQPSWQKAA